MQLLKKAPSTVNKVFMGLLNSHGTPKFSWGKHIELKKPNGFLEIYKKYTIRFNSHYCY